MLSLYCCTLALLNWDPLQIYLDLCCIERQLLCASLMRRGSRNLLFQNEQYKFVFQNEQYKFVFVAAEAAEFDSQLQVFFFQRFCLLAINVHNY